MPLQGHHIHRSRPAPRVTRARSPSAGDGNWLTREVCGIGDIQLRHRPAPGEWAVSEIVGHIADTEERAPGRVRVMTAEDNPRLEPFDQAALAGQRRYIGLDLAEELDRFDRLRKQDVARLEALEGAAWEGTGRHGDGGELSIELYEVHVAAEEADHLAQISRLVSPEE